MAAVATSTQPTPTSPPTSSSSKAPDINPSNDHRILTVTVILAILAAFLIAYVIYITLRVKRRQKEGEKTGPYQGKVMSNEHTAAHITPFGSGGGPNSGVGGPRYKHTPGEDMRIALRRPDGAWHFADSRTPFTPSGVSDIDVMPSPISSSASLISFSSRVPLNASYNKSQEAFSGSGSGSGLGSAGLGSPYGMSAGDQYHRRHLDNDLQLDVDQHLTVPPPPAYHREPCRDHFDDRV